MTTDGPRPSGRSMIVLPRDLSHQLPAEEEVGAKAHHLARLIHLKARVPRFGILDVSAFDAHLKSDSVSAAYRHAMQIQDDTEIVPAAEVLFNAVRSAPLSSAVRHVLDELVDAFTETDLLSVRASVVGPTIETLAMAGHIETFLFVRGKTAVREAVHLVYASAFSPGTVAARIDAGLSPFTTRLAVVVQRMVAADSSGAAASLDIDAPAGRAPQAIIEATLGVGGGASRAQARLPSDIFRVFRPLLAEENLGENAEVEQEVVVKRESLVLDEAQGHGTKLSPTDANAAALPALTAVQARLVADEALRLESLTGRPVSLAFAFSGRLLHILQMHPLETPEGRVSSTTERIFDGRMLPNDLAGPALPATQSLARLTLAPALERALRELGAKSPFSPDVDRALRRLVGTLDADLVGNSAALRACLAATGFEAWTCAAMGRALGSDDLDSTRQGDVAMKGLSTWGRIRHAQKLTRHVRTLREDARVLFPQVQDDSERIRFAGLRDLDPDRLADLVDEILALSLSVRTRQWHARILWALATDLVEEHLRRDVEGASAETGRDLCTPQFAPADLGRLSKIRNLVATVRQSPVLDELFAQATSSEALLDRLEEHPDARAFEAAFRTALDRDGMLPLEGSKLESPTFEERPDLLLDVVRRSFLRDEQNSLEKRMSAAEGKRKKAEYFVTSQASGRALLVFQKSALILRTARAAQDAAAIHLDASRLCVRLSAIARQCLLALGARLYEHDLVDQPADALWLHLDEATGVVRGASPDSAPRALVAARKRAYAQHRDPVDERTVMQGVVAGASRAPSTTPVAATAGESLRAVCASPGEVRGRIRHLQALEVDRAPRVVDDQVAEILVVPGLKLAWLPALVHAGGVIAERGTPSDAVAMALHALSIPCVVGVQHAAMRLKDGEEVLLDATAGAVTRPAQDASNASLAATAPEDFARLAAPSSDSLVRPTFDRIPLRPLETIALDDDSNVKLQADLDATTADLDRTRDDDQRTGTFVVANTIAVDPDQVESVEALSDDAAEGEENAPSLSERIAAAADRS